MLKPPESALTGEVILSYGMFGAGKSEDWATIAEMYRQTDTPGHFHVLSTEWGRAHAVAEGYGPTFFDNCTILECEDFEQLDKASKAAKGAATASFEEHGERRDWIVVDSIGNVRDWARNIWFQRNYEIDYRDWLNTGKSVKEVPSHGWGEMNSIYRTWFAGQILRFPGHAYATAQADTVNMEGSWADAPNIRETYGRHGIKPLGDKEMTFAFMTVLAKRGQPAATPEFTISTVKDKKGREYLNRELVAPLPLGFVMTYLVNVAGWRMDA